MLTATITNTSTLPIQPESVAQAAGVYPPAPYLTLPGSLSWISIAANASVTPIVTVDELEAPASGSYGFGGMKVKDVLQKMIQAGQITVSYVALAVDDVDTYGKAVHAQ